EQVVKLRYRLQNNYDGIVVAENEIRLRRSDLKTNMLFLQGNERIDRAVRQWEQAFSRKEDLIERFKSHNAILKNSMYYFPITIDEAVRLAPSGLRENLQALLRDVLIV
ncbi:DAHL domain-containing protein, partial [Ferrovum sp.]|uniref:DAHL domain-containing protein n=1 Tax=Ferrovum sp. TaxID=2609467 RepID=UPI00262308B1